jgi:hypothetical protein
MFSPRDATGAASQDTVHLRCCALCRACSEMNEHNMRDFCRSAYDSYSERTLLLSAFPTGTSGAQIKATPT